MARKNGKPDFSNYKHEPRASLRHDVVRFIVYARKHAPGAFISYPELVQRVSGYPRPPRIDSHEVEAIRRNISNVRKTLMNEHGCGLLTDPLMGIRATVDSGDLLASQMVKSATRLRSAQDMFTRTSHLIDPQLIPNTPEFQALKAWHKTSVLPVVKAIAATDFASKLLPPKKEEA
jgi:hypothetical protein